MAQKRQHPTSTAPATSTTSSQDTPSGSGTQQTENPRLFESLPIHDRGSVFIAIFSDSPIYMNNPKLLQTHEPFQDAMHRILAYRRQSKQKSLSFQTAAGQHATPSTTTTDTEARSSTTAKVPIKPIYATASDEDGEKYAGKKLERLLNDLDVEGVIVVARWYGGILLGPVRFDHITNVAKDAIRKWRDLDSDGRPVKRVRTEHGSGKQDGLNVVDEVKEKEKLVRILAERDVSVDVLRGLLAEKVGELKLLEDRTLSTQDDKNESPKSDSNLNLNLNQNQNQDQDPNQSSKHQPTNRHKPLNESIPPTAPHKDTSQSQEQPTSSTIESHTGESASTPQQPPQGQDPTQPNEKQNSIKPEYTGMSITKLKQLEKARDASLKWILKQIDLTEVKIKEAERNVSRQSQTD